MVPEKPDKVTLDNHPPYDGLVDWIENTLVKRWLAQGFTEEEIASWDEEERRKQIRLATQPPDEPTQ